jgi:hypothetical protein
MARAYDPAHRNVDHAEEDGGMDSRVDIVEAVSRLAGTGSFATTPIAAGSAVLAVDVPADVATQGRVNHSCDPTLWWDADGRTLVARFGLAAGDELTVDYATATDDPELMVRCNCGSPRCRGMINGDDWQIPQLQQRYSGHWAPKLQHLIDSA